MTQVKKKKEKKKKKKKKYLPTPIFQGKKTKTPTYRPYAKFMMKSET